MFRGEITLAKWENTSTAYGEGEGCNFRVRLAGHGLTAEELQRRAFVASRAIDHVDLGELPFFRDAQPTLENIARFLWQVAAAPGLVFAEVSDRRGFRALYPAGQDRVEVTFPFRARTSRRILDVEVSVRGNVNEQGEVLSRAQWNEIIAAHFDLERCGVGKLQESLEEFCRDFANDISPHTLAKVIVRDGLQKNVVFERHFDDTTLEISPSLPPPLLQPEW